MEKVQPGKLSPVFKKDGIEGVRIYDKESAQANIITIEPSFELAPHITPVDIFMLVLEGKGTFMVGNETFELEKHELIEGPVKIPHGIKNNGGEPLKVLVVKVPRP